MNKRFTYLFLVIIVIAIGYFFLRNINNNPDVAKKAGIQTGQSSARVLAKRAQRVPLSQQLTAKASLLSISKGDILSDISSKVVKIFVSNGQGINTSDTLVLLDKELYYVELTKTRGDFFKALTEFVSELQLTNKQKANQWNTYLSQALQKPILPPLPNSLSQSKLMSMVRYNLHNHYASVKQAEQKLKQCVITAPFSGIVSNIQIFPGAGVSSGSILLTLTDLSRMQVEIDVLETDLKYIHPGTPFQFIDTSADTFYVEAILPEIDPQTRCGKAIAVIPNENMHYKDGQKVMVKLIKQVFRNRLVVPRSAILTRNDRDLVFVVKNGIAKWQYVKTGVSNNNIIEILEGVAVGDTVVTGGHYSLAHDVPVTVELVNLPSEVPKSAGEQ